VAATAATSEVNLTAAGNVAAQSRFIAKGDAVTPYSMLATTGDDTEKEEEEIRAHPGGSPTIPAMRRILSFQNRLLKHTRQKKEEENIHKHTHTHTHPRRKKGGACSNGPGAHKYRPRHVHSQKKGEPKNKRDSCEFI
jgi:hypothetical protein